jgi:hypothetical protein
MMTARCRACLAILGLIAGLTVAQAQAAEIAEASIAIKDHLITPVELHVPAGKRILLRVDNQDSTPEEFESHELKVEKVIPGESSGVVRFGPLEPGRYPFFGEFNEATAKGVVVAE